MTTLLEQLQATLDPLAAGGCSYGMNDRQPPVYPYITFLFVVSPANWTLDGPTDLQNTRVQVDVFSLQILEAAAIATAARTALIAGYTVGGVTDTHLPADPDTKAFRVSADYSIWSKD